MTVLLSAGAVLAVVALLLGIQRLTAGEKIELDERVSRYGVRRSVIVDETTGETRSRSAATAAFTAAVGRAIQGRRFVQGLQSQLAQANLQLTAAEFVSVQVTLAIILGLLGVSVLRNILAVPILGLVGFWVPQAWLRRRQGAYLKAFNEQLGDTMVLLANSLRVGMSLLQAMEMVSREATPPISTEFGRVTREVGVGLSPEDALQHLVRRIRSDDLDLMVTAMVVQHEVGGNLSKILDTIAATIRERVRIKGEIRSITGQQRMAGYMLAALPVAVGGLLLLIAPRYMLALFTPGPWLALPIFAVVGIFIGFFFMRRIVAIEV